MIGKAYANVKNTFFLKGGLFVTDGLDWLDEVFGLGSIFSLFFCGFSFFAAPYNSSISLQISGVKLCKDIKTSLLYRVKTVEIRN